MVDLLDVAVDPQRGAVEAHLAHHLEARLELAQALEGGFAADKFVVVEQHDTVLVRHRNQRFFERAVRAGPGGLLLRAQGEAVDVVTAEALQGGDQVRADTLRGEMGVHIGRRVHHPGTTVRAHGNARHRLDAADHHQILETGTHLHRAEVHRFQTRGAETVELHARHADIPIGDHRRGLGDVRALIPHRRHAAEHDVVDLAGVQVIARLQRLEQAGDQVDRLDAVKRAVLLAFAAGRAHCIENKCFGHDVLRPPMEGGWRRISIDCACCCWAGYTIRPDFAGSMTEMLRAIDRSAQTNGQVLRPWPRMLSSSRLRHAPKALRHNLREQPRQL